MTGIGPVYSGFYKAGTADPNDTREACRVLARELPGVDLHVATWVAEMESGWDPHIENNTGGAVGLWQFMPSTLKAMGLTSGEVKGKGRADQCRILAKMWGGKAPSAKDFYLKLFWPAAVGKPDDYTIATSGTIVWQQNQPLRGPNNGPITAGSVRKKGTPDNSWPTSTEIASWAGASAGAKTGSNEGGGGALLLLVAGLAFLYWQSQQKSTRR